MVFLKYYTKGLVKGSQTDGVFGYTTRVNRQCHALFKKAFDNLDPCKEEM